jgi:hypothetical protein
MRDEVVFEVAVQIGVLGAAAISGIEHLAERVQFVRRVTERPLLPQLHDGLR